MPAAVADQVPSPMSGLEYFPPGRKELMFPLLQQIFLPVKSAAVASFAIAGDNKADARTEPAANGKTAFANISAPLS